MNSYEQQPIEANFEKTPLFSDAIDRFLGEEKEYVLPSMINTAVEKAAIKHQSVLEGGEKEGARTVAYDKYKKTFTVEGKQVTMGEVIASRHLGIEVLLNSTDTSKLSLAERTLRETYAQHVAQDTLFDQLNYDLADILSETTRRQDMLKAKAYAEIRDRSGIESKQIGVIAEKVMIGFAESIAIDRPDLGLSVTPGNAFLDVEQKIDFILETTRKKKGVNVQEGELNAEHKSIGIQFTVNTAKAENKQEQIAKAKERGIAVDDILYVAIDKKTLQQALSQWEKEGKPVHGPWRYMPKQAQQEAIKGLFGDILTAEETQRLIEKIG